VKIIKILIIFLFLIFINQTSYALVDLGVYGGYSFSGEIDTEGTGEQPDPTGFEYGVIGHYNSSLLAFFNYGVGAYYQYSDLSYEGTSNNQDVDTDYNKNIIGLDAYLELSLPLMPLHPYVKIASAIWEETGGDLERVENEWFNTYSTGFGVAFTFFPMYQVFGEYQYSYSKMDGDKNIGNAVHLGLRVNI